MRQNKTKEMVGRRVAKWLVPSQHRNYSQPPLEEEEEEDGEEE